MPLRALVAVIVTTAVMLVPRAWADTAWERYKARFMMPDGRIIDTANGNVSHTEGQGFAMLLAVANNDRPAFDKLWQWTDSTLRDKSNGLFYWRYNPVAPDPIADKNNASDGDTLIAWALLRAQKQWQDKRYAIASDAITASLLKYTVVTFAGRQVMLPGVKGFNLNDHLNLNPSYFIFPAWRAFAERTHLTAWRTLQTDGQALLGQMGWEITPAQRLGGAAGRWQDAASQRVAAADEFRCDSYPAVSLMGRSAKRFARAVEGLDAELPAPANPGVDQRQHQRGGTLVYGRRPAGGARSDAG